MSGSILDRLQARLAAKPAVISIETLFHDLEDARAEITALTAQVAAATSARNGLAPPEPANPAVPIIAPIIAPHIHPGVVAHVHQLMVDAEERLSVNALGSVADFIAKAKSLLTKGKV